MSESADEAMERAAAEPTPKQEPPFRALGHDEKTFWFITARGGQPVAFRASELGQTGTMLALAPASWWEQLGYRKEKGGWDTGQANDHLVSLCYAAGIYDPTRIRGCGAWIEGKDTVLNLGDMLIVNGRQMSPQSRDGQAIYRKSRAMEIAVYDRAAARMVAPLTSAEALRLVDVCKAAGWDDKESMGPILAGWLVIASVCGPLPWRPHICISAEGGAGKSWLFSSVIKRVLGDMALVFSSKTTEPGIRRDLNGDARPILFDESETQTKADREKKQAILDVARASSSKDGAMISIADPTGGGVKRTVVRSCFLFSAINAIATQAADQTRILDLTLRQNNIPAVAAAEFEALEAIVSDVITDDFAPRLLSRTIKNLPVLIANCDIFRLAIARKASSRTGQTYGAILAGLWALGSNKRATAAEADSVVERHAWVLRSVKASRVAPEWERALSHLMQHRTMFNSGHGNEMVALGDLIERSMNREGDTPPEMVRRATEHVGGMGLRVIGNVLWIANRSTPIDKAFAETPWGSAWRATLVRTDGHITNCKPGSDIPVAMRFSRSFVSKTFGVPVATAFGENRDE